MDPRLLIVVGGIVGAAFLQDPIGEKNAARRANDFRYTPDKQVMTVVAAGHRSTLADLLWLQTLPDMSRQFNDRALKKRWIAATTDVITDLEPTFGTVYWYGASHLTVVDRNADEAIKLLEKGIARNPDSGGLLVSLAMVYHEYKHDRAKTIALLREAVKKADIDSLSVSMLASMEVDAHDDLVALGYWAKILDETRDAKVRTTAEYEVWRTKALIAGRALRELEAARKPTPATPAPTVADLRDPKLMDPKVFDLVLDGLQIETKTDAKTGVRWLPRYAKLVELERAVRILQAESFTASYQEGSEGALPSEEQFFRQFGELPPPPDGKKWRYVDGKLRLDPVDAK